MMTCLHCTLLDLLKDLGVCNPGMTFLFICCSDNDIIDWAGSLPRALSFILGTIQNIKTVDIEV